MVGQVISWVKGLVHVLFQNRAHNTFDPRNSWSPVCGSSFPLGVSYLKLTISLTFFVWMVNGMRCQQTQFTISFSNNPDVKLIVHSPTKQVKQYSKEAKTVANKVAKKIHYHISHRMTFVGHFSVPFSGLFSGTFLLLLNHQIHHPELGTGDNLTSFSKCPPWLSEGGNTVSSEQHM